MPGTSVSLCRGRERPQDVSVALTMQLMRSSANLHMQAGSSAIIPDQRLCSFALRTELHRVRG